MEETSMEQAANKVGLLATDYTALDPRIQL
jgi:hypothetical protein